MSNLLIHSMSEFSDLILGSLRLSGARNIVEIGAEFGGMSQLLADYAVASDGCLISIDPAPRAEFVAWANSAPGVTHLPAASLDVIDKLHDVDAWVIDGDHNYYTVLHELQAADALCQREAKPMLAFLHDVSWPTARRDMYYAPDRIPAEHRHPHTFDAGTMLDRAELVPGQGFRGGADWAMANHIGGPRNGVLTAVEDFIEAERAKGRELAWAHVPAVFGLGILFDATAPWSGDVALHVAPFHNNALLAAMERNRLRNYMKVIEWQDRAA